MTNCTLGGNFFFAASISPRFLSPDHGLKTLQKSPKTAKKAICIRISRHLNGDRLCHQHRWHFIQFWPIKKPSDFGWRKCPKQQKKTEQKFPSRHICFIFSVSFHFQEIKWRKVNSNTRYLRVALSRVGTSWGCSGAISHHLHFRVLSGINRFQINETGFETGFQSKVLKKFRTLRLKPVSNSCKLVLKLLYTVKYSEM